MVERDHARNDRPLMQRKPEPMAELQAEGGHLVGETKILRLREYLADLVGGDARLDQRDRLVEPFACLLVGVVLYRRRAPDIEGAVVAGAGAHERLHGI